MSLFSGINLKSNSLTIGTVFVAVAAILIPLGKALSDVVTQTKQTKESADLAVTMIAKYEKASKKAAKEEVQKLTDKFQQQRTMLESLQAAEARSVISKQRVAASQAEIKQSYLDAEEAALKYLTRTGQIKNAEGRLIEIEKEKLKSLDSTDKR